MEPAPALRPNWPLLAAIRFVLAMGVAAGHVLALGFGGHGLWLLGSLGGSTCVAGFLILSGFSIAHSYEHDAAGFYRRRFWRIYPVYTCAVGLATLPYLLAPRALGGPSFYPISTRQLFALLTFTNGFWITTPQIISPAWTLSAEVALYACAPWFARIGKRGVLAVGAVSLAAYLWNCQGESFHLTHTPLVPLGLAWIWLMGWCLHHWPQPRWVRFGLPALAATMLGLSEGGWAALGVVAVGGTLLALHFGARVRMSAKVARVCVFLGDLSYPFYLVHYASACYYHSLTDGYSGWMALCVGLLISTVIVLVVDRPLRAMGGRGSRQVGLVHSSARLSPTRFLKCHLFQAWQLATSKSACNKALQVPPTTPLTFFS